MTDDPAGRPAITGAIPYVFCEDAGAIADWCCEILGFTERSRWHSDDGHVANVELTMTSAAGGSEVWLDGAWRTHGLEGGTQPTWVGLVVDDVRAVHRQIVAEGHLAASGVEVPEPVDREFGVRMLTIPDPEGHQWGFCQRL